MNRKLLLGITGIFLILAALTGCRGKKATLILTKEPQGTPLPTQDALKASVTGNVFSTTANKPYPKAPVWLAEVFRKNGQAVYVLDHAFSPAVYADDQGVFTISNVDPKEYVIVVGNPEGSYVVIPDDTGRARAWSLEAGKVLDVGRLSVSLSPSNP